MNLLFFMTILIEFLYWQASEASETVSGVSNGNRRYMYNTCNLNFVARAQSDV